MKGVLWVWKDQKGRTASNKSSRLCIQVKKVAANDIIVQFVQELINDQKK